MPSPPLSTQLSTITSSELAISFSLGKVCIVRAVCESCNSQTPNYLQLWGCPKIRGHKTSKIHHFLCGNQWFGVFLCPKLRGIPHFWTNLMQSSKKPTRNHPSWNERRKVTKVTKSARLSRKSGIFFPVHLHHLNLIWQHLDVGNKMVPVLQIPGRYLSAVHRLIDHRPDTCSWLNRQPYSRGVSWWSQELAKFWLVSTVGFSLWPLLSLEFLFFFGLTILPVLSSI